MSLPSVFLNPEGGGRSLTRLIAETHSLSRDRRFIMTRRERVLFVNENLIWLSPLVPPGLKQVPHQTWDEFRWLLFRTEGYERDQVLLVYSS